VPGAPPEQKNPKREGTLTNHIVPVSLDITLYFAVILDITSASRFHPRFFGLLSMVAWLVRFLCPRERAWKDAPRIFFFDF
jgi:hypothetical protein